MKKPPNLLGETPLDYLAFVVDSKNRKLARNASIVT